MITVFDLAVSYVSLLTFSSTYLSWLDNYENVRRAVAHLERQTTEHSSSLTLHQLFEILKELNSIFNRNSKCFGDK